ncbi:chaplin [Streptomyces olivaceoviridis]|uniref:chaplin n=1 Tax=Streptomyces olivaceoviridis TaxID=1921 RepID=UPI0037BA84A9
MKKTAAAVAGAILALSLAGPAFADSDANGAATNSPGFVSGNVVQIPIHIPINLCGNTINVVAALNPAAGNTCINGDIHKN